MRDYLPTWSQDLSRVVLDWGSRRRRSARARSFEEGEGAGNLAQKVSPQGTVLAGPFAGLWMGHSGTWGGLAARLSGSYEQELHASVEAILADRPSVVIDVGAAEGYYAVGIARALPGSQVHAFEIEPTARGNCRLVAERNGVSNLKIHGRATPKRLAALLRPTAFVLCDCEGYEQDLLDPIVTPTLANVKLLVELHEFCRPGVTQVIADRFQRSHEIELITATQREVASQPQLKHLSEIDAFAALQEGRPGEPCPMQWAVMTPRLFVKPV